MSRKGGSKQNKRISLPSARHVFRKAHTWAIRPSPGPHQKQAVLPLGEIIRDKLGLAANRKETKVVLNSKKVLVDEKVRTSSRFPVGLFDIVRANQERFRVVFDANGRLQLQPMKDTEKPLKICKTVRKTVLGKNRFQLTTNDGRTFMQKEVAVRVGDSLLIELPSQKIVSVFSLQEGNVGYVFKGTHVGAFETISKINTGTMQKDGLVELKGSQEDFQTLLENVIVVGEKKPAIALNSVTSGNVKA